MFRGFFHGVSDAEQEVLEKSQPRLHSVVIPPSAYCIGKRVMDMGLDDYGVEVKTIRRNSFKPYDAQPDSNFLEGDAVVLLGKPEALIRAEKLMLTGR